MKSISLLPVFLTALAALILAAAPPGWTEDDDAEIPFDVASISPETFFRRFPEGTYEVEGLTLDDQEMESETQVTHLLPARPDHIEISGHAAPEDCDEGPIPSVSGPVMIRWDAVTASHPKIGRTGEKIEVVKHQVVVEREEPTVLVYSVDLPPSVTELEVPP
jgi:hypothetical protein